MQHDTAMISMEDTGWPCGASNGLTRRAPVRAARPAPLAGSSDAEVMLLAAGREDAWLTALSSACDAGETVVIVSTGPAAEAARAAARALGLAVETCGTGPRAARLGVLRDRLASDREGHVRAVFAADEAEAAESETASVRAVLDHSFHDAMLVADVTAMPGGLGRRAEQHGIDIAVAAGTPGGIVPKGFTAVALGRTASGAAARRWYENGPTLGQLPGMGLAAAE